MNNRLHYIAGVCLAVVLSIAGSSLASADTLLNVTLTQEVSVGNVALLPGDYVVRELSGDRSSPILFIHSANGSDVTTLVQRVTTPHHEAAAQTKVILRSAAGGYQLDTIWIAGQDFGYQFPSLTGRE
jgi:hypothetical protein